MSMLNTSPVKGLAWGLTHGNCWTTVSLVFGSVLECALDVPNPKNAMIKKNQHSGKTRAWDQFPKGGRVESHAAAPLSSSLLWRGGQGLF